MKITVIKAGRKQTKAAGAVVERALIQRYIARRIAWAKGQPFGLAYQQGHLLAMRELSAWLKAQPLRTQRPGGIGRTARRQHAPSEPLGPPTHLPEPHRSLRRGR